jgi:hypothetical protein
VILGADPPKQEAVSLLLSSLEGIERITVKRENQCCIPDIHHNLSPRISIYLSNLSTEQNKNI